MNLTGNEMITESYLPGQLAPVTQAQATGGARGEAGGGCAHGVAGADPCRDQAVSELYSAHYHTLVRLAAFLLRDSVAAEEVVQDSFVAVYGNWRRLRDTGKALSYLRQSVINRSRSLQRHRAVVARYQPQPPPDAASAEQGAITLLERSAVVAALRGLPARQREALVLRYYAGLSEADIARAMGITGGAVKSHAARGIAALRTTLDCHR
jgi:RNA polymerase sigma-70 factor (sigma-E family)